MNVDIDSVLTNALALPTGDRIELVEAILASLAPNDRPPFDESWREVILRRSAEIESGKVSGVPWDVVKSRARLRDNG